VSGENRTDGGVPFRVGAIPGTPRREETWAGANEAKDETLRLRSVKRRAGAAGLEVRHSDYGYALIGTDRQAVNGRKDMSLKEVEAWLKAAKAG
jgi:hypothetical protein